MKFINNKIKFFKNRLFFVVCSFLFFSLSKKINAQGTETSLNGLNETAGSAGLNTSTTDISIVIGKIIGIALSFIGALFFILMLYAGFLWMTDRGNEAQVKKAKDLISAAIIGLIIVSLAYAITDFIGGII